MKKYLRVYKMLIRMNISLALTYRASFINGLIATFSWGVFQLVWIDLLTYRNRTVFGWSRNELILLAASFIFLIAVFHCFFSRNFERMSRVIDRGQLDSILLKPIDSQFLLSTSIIRIANTVRMVLGLFLIWHTINQMHISISLVNIIGYLALSVFGLILLYSLWFIVSTTLIWFPQLSNLVDFLFTINGMSRYPTEMIYRFPVYFMIIALPFAISVVTPTKVLFQKALNGEILLLLSLSIGLFLLSRLFWKFALRYYTSTGS